MNESGGGHLQLLDQDEIDRRNEHLPGSRLWREAVERARLEQQIDERVRPAVWIAIVIMAALLFAFSRFPQVFRSLVYVVGVCATLWGIYRGSVYAGLLIWDLIRRRE